MKLKKYKGKIRKYAGITIRGWIIFFIVMAVACVICVLLRSVSSSDVHVPLIFVLAVLIISLLTDGYFFGLLAALSSVITVNYAFTYPYLFSMPSAGIFKYQTPKYENFASNTIIRLKANSKSIAVGDRGWLSVSFCQTIYDSSTKFDMDSSI